ncbi:MAG: hypothetical protein UT43_C0006G0024 [Parcubacteria group bacterium GW2011_GWC1_39_29]|nr:MAG: hypothetical protein UT43_C0006G0024 [Parcubacteria group bacterium GW2011_GWC1_39_29]
MTDHYGDREERELPNPPHWTKALGVGIVVSALAVGTGELIMWPHLVTKYGLGLIWLAILGITVQYFINQEVARHALATGESFFTSSSRLFKWFAPFWILSSVLLYVWPGWATAIGTTLKELMGFGSYMQWAFASLILVLILTFTGRVAYHLLERTLKIIIPAFFFLLIISTTLIIRARGINELWGAFESFKNIPKDVDVNVLLGAVVFAGAGGLLNLCVSLWYRDKQIGMGKYVGRIINPITGKIEAVSYKGYSFSNNEHNNERWKKWMRFVRIDQGLIFWFISVITILLLSLNAYLILTPMGLVPEGLDVAVVQAHIFGEVWGEFGFDLFLLMAFLMLFSVMWTIIDAFTRIVADVVYVNSQIGPFTKYLTKIRNISLSHLYYGLIILIILINMLLLSFRQPLVLLTISAVMGGFVMVIYIPILIYLNNFKLPKQLRPSILTNVALFCGLLFYGSFCFLVLKQFV